MSITHSETIGQIAKALAAAQKGIKVAAKDATNPHFRSRYSDLQSIDEAARPHLCANGIAITQGVGADDGYAWCQTMLVHSESGEWMSCTLRLPVTKWDAQGIGSCLTYARRYSMAGLVAVPSGELDDDGEAAVGRGAPRGEVAVPPPATVVPFEPLRPPVVMINGLDELPDEPPENYPFARHPSELRPVWKSRVLGLDGNSHGRTTIHYTDAVGYVTKLTEGGGPKSPTSVILWHDPERTRFSTFRRWTIPEGVGSVVRLKGVTRTAKGDAIYWNFESVEAYKPDHDTGVDIDIPF